MTELIPGKRYRWTVDGIADGDGNLDLDNGGTIWAADLHGTGVFELLPDPLPTTPDSVVLDNARTSWQLMDDGRWFMAGSTDGLSPAPMAKYAPFTVLFDAGAQR